MFSRILATTGWISMKLHVNFEYQKLMHISPAELWPLTKSALHAAHTLCLHALVKSLTIENIILKLNTSCYML